MLADLMVMSVHVDVAIVHCMAPVLRLLTLFGRSMVVAAVPLPLVYERMAEVEHLLMDLKVTSACCVEESLEAEMLMMMYCSYREEIGAEPLLPWFLIRWPC